MKYIVLDTDVPIVMFANKDTAQAFANYLEHVSGDTHYIHIEKCREEDELLKEEEK